jgi:hypothetical protein
MKIREQAAKAIDELLGSEVSIENISIKRLIDTFETFGEEVARKSYEKGNDDGADGINKVAQYLKEL